MSGGRCRGSPWSLDEPGRRSLPSRTRLVDRYVVLKRAEYRETGERVQSTTPTVKLFSVVSLNQQSSLSQSSQLANHGSLFCRVAVFVTLCAVIGRLLVPSCGERYQLP
jgi:hypothetical protein